MSTPTQETATGQTTRLLGWSMLILLSVGFWAGLAFLQQLSWGVSAVGLFLSCVWVALASWIAGVLNFGPRHVQTQQTQTPPEKGEDTPREDAEPTTPHAHESFADRARASFLVQRILREGQHGVLLIDPEAARILGANPKAYELLGLEGTFGSDVWTHELQACNISQNTTDLLKATAHNADRNGEAHCDIPTSKGNYHFHAQRVGEGDGRLIQMDVDLELVPITREVGRVQRKRTTGPLARVAPLDQQPFSSSSVDSYDSMDDIPDDDELPAIIPRGSSLTTSMTREIGNISHDLRTPMVSLRGYMEIMSRGDLGPINENQARCLQMSLRNLDRMVIMVENLLEYSKMSQGERSIKVESFNLSALAQDILDLCQSRAQKSNVDLALRSDIRDGAVVPISDRLLIRADRIKLQRLLTNLVDNALKFTPSGGKVRVYARPATPKEVQRILRDLPSEHPHAGTSSLQSTWLSLRVQDTGCGIQQDNLNHIFERSFTLSHGLPTQDGSGFGLAIVDNIVRLHDGIIEVQSQPGVGTVFSLWLPILQRYQDRRSNPIIPPILSTQPLSQPNTIYVLDDDLECANFARFALSRQGHTVHVSTNPIALCDNLRSLNVDLLILDYTIPGYNGGELLKEVKHCEGLEHIPVLIISGHSDPNLRRSLLQAGAHGFLVKPYTIDDLTDTVAQLLQASQADSPVSRPANH